MAATPPPLQTTFVQAAAYSALFLDVLEHVFPDRKLLEISDDERRIVQNETDNLLVRSRWRIESYVFVNQFALQQQPPTNIAPADTVLGALLTPPDPTKPPGQYV
jgi:hypothetical protein